MTDGQDWFGLTGGYLQTAPGERTYYHDYGSGVPVLFVHGSGAGVSAAANWWRNLPVLGEQCRAIAFDLIGFGRTEAPPGTPYGITAWVEHTLRVMAALDLTEAFMVGNSLGGWITLQLALDHPQRVRGLIPMGTGGMSRDTTEVLKSHMRPQMTDAGMTSLLRDFVVDPSLITEDLLRARHDTATAPGAQARYAEVVAARERDRAASPLDEERLSGLQCPVLLIHGREDIVVPPLSSWRLLKCIPTSELHVLAGCGHWTQIERHVAFNRLVGDFLAKHAEVPAAVSDGA